MLRSDIFSEKHSDAGHDTGLLGTGVGTLANCNFAASSQHKSRTDDRQRRSRTDRGLTPEECDYRKNATAQHQNLHATADPQALPSRERRASSSESEPAYDHYAQVRKAQVLSP